MCVFIDVCGQIVLVPKLGTFTYANLMPTIILWGITNLIFHKEKWKNRGSNLPKDVQEVSERGRLPLVTRIISATLSYLF